MGLKGVLLGVPVRGGVSLAPGVSDGDGVVDDDGVTDRVGDVDFVGERDGVMEPVLLLVIVLEGDTEPVDEPDADDVGVDEEDRVFVEVAVLVLVVVRVRVDEGVSLRVGDVLRLAVVLADGVGRAEHAYCGRAASSGMGALTATQPSAPTEKSNEADSVVAPIPSVTSAVTA